MIDRMNEAETHAAHIGPARRRTKVAGPRFPGYVARTVLDPEQA